MNFDSPVNLSKGQHSTYHEYKPQAIHCFPCRSSIRLLGSYAQCIGSTTQDRTRPKEPSLLRKASRDGSGVFIAPVAERQERDDSERQLKALQHVQPPAHAICSRSVAPHEYRHRQRRTERDNSRYQYPFPLGDSELQEPFHHELSRVRPCHGTALSSRLNHTPTTRVGERFKKGQRAEVRSSYCQVRRQCAHGHCTDARPGANCPILTVPSCNLTASSAQPSKLRG